MLITQQNIKFCLNSFCNSSFIFTINKTLTKDFSNKNTKYYMCYYIRLKKCSLNAFKRCIILYEIFLNFYLSINYNFNLELRRFYFKSNNFSKNALHLTWRNSDIFCNLSLQFIAFTFVVDRCSNRSFLQQMIKKSQKIGFNW